jgi:hypothetical protein
MVVSYTVDARAEREFDPHRRVPRGQNLTAEPQLDRITSMRRLAALLALSFLLAPLGCGGDDEGDEHTFDTYAECFIHLQQEEGASDVGATTECDATFELSHDDNADCQADHEADVGDGVPQAAIDAHCDTEFPPA